MITIAISLSSQPFAYLAFCIGKGYLKMGSHEENGFQAAFWF